MQTSPASPARRAAAILIAALLVAIARSAVAQGDFSERLATLTSQIQAEPTNPDLWLNRAAARRQHKDFEAAFTDVDKAGQLKPDWAPVPLERARIFFDMSKLDDAVRESSACLKLDAANTDALILRARSYAWLKNFEPAAADYSAALASKNFTPSLDLYLERARAQAALKNWDDAIHGLDEGMKRIGETPTLALPALEYERERGTFEAALARLEHCQNFLSAEAYLATRGEILLQANRPADAAAAFQAGLTALESHSNDKRSEPLNAALEERLRAGLKRATSPAP